MRSKELLTIPQLAKILGISRIAVYNKVKRGEIKAFRIGKIYAIPKGELEGILGKTLSEEARDAIDMAVKKAVRDYGEVLRLLGNE